VSRKEEREHLQKLIELHRANLQHYEELEAKYGLDCPVYVKNAKEEARKGLTETRAKLAALEGSAPGAESSIPAIPQNLPSRSEFIGRETVHVKTTSASDEALHLVCAAVASKIARLELALEMEMAHKRLKPFEEKYGVTSEQFMAEMAAKDLEGGDDEYVQWAGEYKLMCDLKEKLTQLKEIQITKNRGM
jgi:hypothetical protein